MDTALEQYGVVGHPVGHSLSPFGAREFRVILLCSLILCKRPLKAVWRGQRAQ
jgi:hypothetical protein